MPIGLALALGILPFEGAWLAWIITVLIIQYMIFINQDARKWVIDFTLAALAVSFIFSPMFEVLHLIWNTLKYSYTIHGNSATHTPIILVALHLTASYAKKSSVWTDIFMMVCGFARV